MGCRSSQAGTDNGLLRGGSGAERLDGAGTLSRAMMLLP